MKSASHVKTYHCSFKIENLNTNRQPEQSFVGHSMGNRIKKLKNTFS